MIYAVKSVNNQEVNKIFLEWKDCAALVLGKKAVYKSFSDTKDITAEIQAEEFLKTAPVKKEEYGHGYVPVFKGKHVIYGRYIFDRCLEKENGFSVRVYENDKGERVCCRGYYLPSNRRLVYAFTGMFVNNKNYGYEFFVESYTEHVTETKQSIINYLSSGVIKGIGKKRAEQIYDKFKEESLKVIEETPEKLLCIKGVNERVIKKISESYVKGKGARPIISYLLNFGISQKYGMTLYAQYGVHALNRIKRNPYLLCNIRGLTFEDADEIARKEKLPMDSFERLEACVLYVMSRNEITGCTGMEQNQLGKKVYECLVYFQNEEQIKDTKHMEEFIFSGVLRMLKEKTLHVCRMGDKKFLFSHHMEEIEQALAVEFLKIFNNKNQEKICNLEGIIETCSKTFPIEFDKIQRQSVKTALSHSVCVMSGGPGTGKTTTIKLAIKVYKTLFPENDVILLAPTGRAVAKMEQSTGYKAYTIHSYIHYYENSLNENEIEIENAFVIVDEVSMVDVYVAERLFKTIKEGCKLMLVGDMEQLPSVGPGAVLRDIIDSNVVPVIFLNHVFRQKGKSQIYANIKRMHDGNTDLKAGSDFFFYDCGSMEDAKNIMLELYMQGVQKYGLLHVMCLLPYRKYTAGVIEMNRLIQSKVNPPQDGKKEVSIHGTIYREGDVVMQLVNDTLASNGDIGRIEKIYNPEDALSDLDQELDNKFYILVKINNKTIVYGKNDLDKIEHAYAMSIHKAQGSEADCIITCLTSFHRGMIYHAIPYVALSRGVKQVNFVGDREVLGAAIKNRTKNERITLTKYYLQYLTNQFVLV